MWCYAHTGRGLRSALAAVRGAVQGNAKTLEGDQHPDRDAQFRYINQQAKDHQAAGEPVISVDTKKREQPGRLPMGGQEWRQLR
jgi:UDP-N-acetylmuramyl tripeptide synthase